MAAHHQGRRLLLHPIHAGLGRVQRRVQTRPERVLGPTLQDQFARTHPRQNPVRAHEPRVVYPRWQSERVLLGPLDQARTFGPELDCINRMVQGGLHRSRCVGDEVGDGALARRGHPLHPSDSTSAWARTVWVAFSRWSGG